MKLSDILEISNWARAELQDAEENGDVVSRVEALRRVQRVLKSMDDVWPLKSNLHITHSK